MKVFGMVAKNKETSNPFFAIVRRGCEAQAAKLGVNCSFVGPENPVPEEQIEIVRQFIEQRVDGIAISSLDDESTILVVQEAYVAGIPVVTFDSDAPSSKRVAYVGTNNRAFGSALGKILLQLEPRGGKYALVSGIAPNIVERNAGFREYLETTTSNWFEANNSPSDTKDQISIALDQVEAFSRSADVSAIVAMGGWPMFDDDPTKWQRIVASNRNITYVSADTLPIQMDFISTGYVNGLVGQDPYDMGVQAINILFERATGNNGTYSKNRSVFGTNFVEMVRVPLELPAVNVDNNFVGSLRYMGFGFFGVISLLSIGFGAWTYSKREIRVVVASQPMFLFMLLFGVLLCSSSLIPLSLDDTDPAFDGETADRACMSVPWLSSIGFTIMFSALYSKTWRINKIFHNPFPSARMKVTLRDLYLPLFCLLSANVINLTIWTVIAPIRYDRLPNGGTDGWNRVISTYGACKSGSSSIPFMIVLGVINISAVALANWQAYEARDIQSEFSESRYIAIAMACILQAHVSAVPILLLTSELPQVHYLVMIIMIFVINMSVLLLVFVPKVQSERKLRKQADEDKKRHLQDLQDSKMEVRLKFASTQAWNDTGSDLNSQNLGLDAAHATELSIRQRRSSLIPYGSEILDQSGLAISTVFWTELPGSMSARSRSPGQGTSEQKIYAGAESIADGSSSSEGLSESDRQMNPIKDAHVKDSQSYVVASHLVNSARY
jgi:ABC-type sugar transport system substrate-binding protein